MVGCVYDVMLFFLKKKQAEIGNDNDKCGEDMEKWDLCASLVWMEDGVATVACIIATL